MYPSINGASRFSVALLAEGVDRNTYYDPRLAALGEVALLAEGVDRNLMLYRRTIAAPLSPSSRRAWIEMPQILKKLRKTLGRPPRGGRG